MSVKDWYIQIDKNKKCTGCAEDKQPTTIAGLKNDIIMAMEDIEVDKWSAFSNLDDIADKITALINEVIDAHIEAYNKGINRLYDLEEWTVKESADVDDLNNVEKQLKSLKGDVE